MVVFIILVLKVILFSICVQFAVISALENEYIDTIIFMLFAFFVLLFNIKNEIFYIRVHINRKRLISKGDIIKGTIKEIKSTAYCL